MSLEKERQVLENTVSKLLEDAKKGGADKAEVCATFSEQTRILIEKQDFHLAASDEGYQWGLRVLRGKKQGFVSSNSCDPQHLKEMASKCVEIASLSIENPYYDIPKHEKKTLPPSLWDETLHHLPLSVQKDWAKALFDEATRDSRMRVNDALVARNSHALVLANSEGTHQNEVGTSAQWSLMGMAVDGPKITSFDYISGVARKQAATLPMILADAAKLRNELIENLSVTTARSYRGTVLFSPRAVADIFLSVLSHHFNARCVFEKTSRWTKENLGQSTLNELVTLKDNPWNPERAGYSTFDREGTPTQVLSLIEKGILKTFTADSYAARALGVGLTGHAAGGTSSIPTVGTHCLEMEGGSRSVSSWKEDIGSRQKHFLLVQRFSGQTDPVTGDFSGVAKGGHWYEGSQKVGCIKETLIAGNVFDALGSALVGLSSEVEVLDKNESAPFLISDGISVTSEGTSH